MVYHVTDRYDLVVPGTDDPVKIASEDLPRFADTVDAALAVVDGRAADTLSAARSYTDARTDSIELGTNLWDPSRVAYGHILTGGSAPDGSIVPSAPYDTSGFIPVEAGQAYTLWGVTASGTGADRRGPQSWVFYDSLQNFVSHGIDASMPVQTVTAPEDGFLRASFRSEVVPRPQVERGATATTYQPFRVVIAGLDPQLDESKIPAGVISPDKTTFAHTGKNILDPTEFLYDTFVQGGETAPLAGYTTSGMSPVEPGQPYVGVVRMWAWYDADGEYLGGLNTGSNTAVSVQTAPTDAAFVRASWDSARNAFMQIEQGETPTGYEPFGVFIPNLVVEGGGESSGGPMTVSLSSGQMDISSGFGESLLTVSTALHGSANGGFNFLSANLGGEAVSVGTDEIAPIRTFNTVGANHGYTCISIITAAGKSAADLGSVWTDGVREFTLLLVDGDRLTFGHEYTVGSDGVMSSENAGPAGILQHVSGASNTADVSVGTRTGGQLYPSIQRLIVTPLVDGQAIEDGTYRGVTAQVREVYEVLDYASIIDTARANIGTPFHEVRVAGAVRVENVYTFKPGLVLVDTALTELRPTTLGSCGFVQAIRPAGTGGRIVPGVTGWTTPKSFADTWSSQIITASDLIDPAIPPTMSLDVMDWGGFALGYFPHAGGVTSSAERIEHGGSRLWDLRSTQKSYPSPWAAKAAGWGRVEAHAYRAYLTPAQADAVAVVAEDAHAAHAALAALVPLHNPDGGAKASEGSAGPDQVDTGWLDVQDLLMPGLAITGTRPDLSYLNIARTGDTVWVRMRAEISSTSQFDGRIIELPAGFRMGIFGAFGIARISGDRVEDRTVFSSANNRTLQVSTGSLTANSLIEFTLSFRTPDSWPVSYPGPVVP